MPDYQLHRDGRLAADNQELLLGLDPGWELLPDDAAGGVFLRGHAQAPAASLRFSLGRFAALQRFTSCHRADPWWLEPKGGREERDVLPETQFLLGELRSGEYLLILPLVEAGFRVSLQGDPGEGILLALGESNDPATVAADLTAVYLACGSDPFALIRAGLASIAARLGTCRLRAAKAVPRLLDHFGWCTGDAFPDNRLTAADLEAGLESFARGGITPRFVLLADGWLSVQSTTERPNRLASFAANAGFPAGLATAVQTSRCRFGVELFYAWHPLAGYWSGVEPAAFPAYRTREVTPVFGEGIVHFCPDLAQAPVFGLIEPADLGRFLADFYRHLRAAGVDGVTVAHQDVLEALAAGLGGRAALLRQGRQALETAARACFQDELRNCMCLANDALYTMADSTLTRTGPDASAGRPESHGLELYANAQTALFVGDLVHPDWGSFKSGHVTGPFHAAARALSGGPVYVADGPGEQDFALLHKLVLSDGSILRPQEPARPTKDCLAADPCHEEVLLKIFSHNKFNSVVGAFNCQYHEDDRRRHFIAGSISPQDAEGLAGDDFALYSHQSQKLVRCRLTGRISLWLAELGWEIVTIVPIVQGLAPIGLADRLNSGAAVTGVRHTGNESAVDLRDGGEFAAWCEHEPWSVVSDDERWTFQYDRHTKLLRVQVDHRGPCTLRLTLERDGTAAQSVRRTGRWRPVTPAPTTRLFRLDGQR